MRTIISEILRDRTLDWFERLIESPWCDRVCWAVIGAAALYFGPIVIRTFIG